MKTYLITGAAGFIGANVGEVSRNKDCGFGSADLRR